MNTVLVKSIIICLAFCSVYATDENQKPGRVNKIVVIKHVSWNTATPNIADIPNVVQQNETHMVINIIWNGGFFEDHYCNVTQQILRRYNTLTQAMVLVAGIPSCTITLLVIMAILRRLRNKRRFQKKILIKLSNKK